MQLITRAQWGARPREAGAATPFDPRGVAVHWVGGGWRWPWAHSVCDDKVRGIQADHMDSNGWSDIAYNFLPCPHGYVFEGRGLNRRSAANGDATVNTYWYAVCCLWGSESGSATEALLTAARDAIDHCRNNGGAGNELRGHRDLNETNCPGDQLYAWVRAGAPRPTDTPEEDMPTAKEIVDELLARKLGNGTTFGGNITETADRVEVIYGRTGVIQGTLGEGGGINAQLDAIQTTQGDEDAQTDRIETRVMTPIDYAALAAGIAERLPTDEPVTKEALEAALREVLGSVDEVGGN